MLHGGFEFDLINLSHTWLRSMSSNRLISSEDFICLQNLTFWSCYMNLVHCLLCYLLACFLFLISVTLFCCRFGNIGISGDNTAPMRFKKGDKVEVLSQKEVPSGSWRCGEIICGNGHNYTVRYDGDAASTDKTVFERVSRKAIRPCPPSLDVSEYWVPGDVVEVFNNYSWKMATISKILGKKYFLVRLLGSSLEFKVSKFDIRVRQSWLEDKWIVVGEVFFVWLCFFY